MSQLNRVTLPDWNQMNTIAEFLAAWFEEDLIGGTEQKLFDRYYRSYKNRFGDYIQYHYTNQTQELMDILGDLDQPRVLEVGCGCGTESIWMALQGATVTGIDIQTDRLEVAQKRQKIVEQSLKGELSCSFAKRSIFELDSEEKYDVIWMEQAFHHIEPRQVAVDKLAALVKKGGFIVISESNAWNPLTQIMLYKSRGFSTIKEYSDDAGVVHQYGDERILTANKLATEFNKRNIALAKVRYFRLFPNTKWAKKLQGIENYIPQWFVCPFTHYNYVGQK
jgi:2-polyprenyl-3-methyl-5-hydroxy-6-metoxy-1,4-benzoquinol methylase